MKLFKKGLVKLDITVIQLSLMPDCRPLELPLVETCSWAFQQWRWGRELDHVIAFEEKLVFGDQSFGCDLMSLKTLLFL